MIWNQMHLPYDSTKVEMKKILNKFKDKSGFPFLICNHMEFPEFPKSELAESMGGSVREKSKTRVAQLFILWEHVCGNGTSSDTQHLVCILL